MSLYGKKVESFEGHQEPLLASVKRRKMAWFGHVTGYDSLYKTIMQGTIEGGHRRGCQLVGQCQTMNRYYYTRIADDCC